MPRDLIIVIMDIKSLRNRNRTYTEMHLVFIIKQKN